MNASLAQPARSEDAAAFRDDMELILTLLALLEVRLAQIIAAGQPHGVAEHPFKGFVISNTEVAQALGADADGAAAHPEYELGGLWSSVEYRVSTSLGLQQLRDRFGLTQFEVECVLVCLAPEVDRKFERIFAYLNDDIAQRRPSADLLMRLLVPRSSRAQLQGLLASDARLVRFGLLAPSAERGGLETFRVSDGVARFLLGRGGVDAALAKLWRLNDHPLAARTLWSTLSQVQELPLLMHAHLQEAPRTALVIVLQGRSGSGRRFVAEHACRQLGYGCLALDSRALRRSPAFEQAIVIALRDSLLSGAPVLLQPFDDWCDDSEHSVELRCALERWLEELGWILFVSVEDAAPVRRMFRAARVIELTLEDPNTLERAQAWRTLLDSAVQLGSPEPIGTAESLAAKYRLSYGEIATAMQRAEGARTPAMSGVDWSQLLHRQAAAAAAPRLKALAHQITPTHGFDDLVLSPHKKEMLRDVVRRVRHRQQVLESWAFDRVLSRGRGMVALFFGPSGTGKTMAAEVLAAELQMDLYRVDLAGVVSKYIGETEKNLRSLFDEADRSDAILFFDEADALFGKRSDVKDAHDRYANIEINYLLQRIESFEGIAILATNMRQHLDEAFMRRIHITIEFTVPKAAERLGIWRKSFPDDAPLDAHFDLEFLAERFELSGGAIRNVALGAAFLAADQSHSIGMPQLVSALHRELVKSGRRVHHADFGAYAIHLPAEARPAPAPMLL